MKSSFPSSSLSSVFRTARQDSAVEAFEALFLPAAFLRAVFFDVFFFAAVFLVAVFLVAAFFAAAFFLRPRRSGAAAIAVALVAGIVGVIVLAFIALIVLKFRDRGQAMPEQTHGKPALEIALTILPALILIGVAIPTVGTVLSLAETDDTECIVNVTGQQWWWEVDYAQQDGCGGIAEPIVTSGQMIIPINTPVLVRGTSRDVIHSFWVPRLNGKRDMVPGRVHTWNFNAEQPGIYAGQCAEFCGLSHANMRMEVVALTPEDFEAWREEMK